MDPYMERDFPRGPYNDLDRRHFDEFGRRPPLDEFEGRRPPFDEFDQRRPLLERPPREHLLDDPYLRPARDPYGYPPRGETNFFTFISYLHVLLFSLHTTSEKSLNY